MASMRTAPALTRAIVVAALALVMALRVLSPAGFMPSFEHGAVTIVACADADPLRTQMVAHHAGHSRSLHQKCPYAAASGAASLGADLAGSALILAFAVALLPGRRAFSLERSCAYYRPPPTGPPLPA